MRICIKSDNPNDKFTANDFKFDHNVIMFMKNIRGTAA